MTRQHSRHPANHIRLHRRRVGLTQHELEQVLGYTSKGSVARYERLLDMPTLGTAIGFEIIFRTPVAQIFWGLRNAVELEIEKRLAGMEVALGQRSAKDRDANATARKLMWLAERKQSEDASSA